MAENETRSGEASDGDPLEFEGLISTLPTASSGVCRFPFYSYNGVWLNRNQLEGALRAQNHFQAKPEDIIVCSFPKTGTTWLKALTFATARRRELDLESPTHPLRSKNPHDCAPILEFQLQKLQEIGRSKRVISTHVPYHLLPDSIRDSACKIVYVWRDPKDCLVSVMHFVSGLKFGKEVEVNAVSVEDAFSQFTNGQFPYGPYWNHVIGFLKAGEAKRDKIMCFKYEDLANDAHGSVRRLAEFIGQPFSPSEEQNGAAKKIVDLCSFENLKSAESTTSGAFRSDDEALIVKNRFFYRNGKVGDWKNHLSTEMGARMDSLFRERFAEAGLNYGA